MAKKVFNMQGGSHSAASYSALENRAWGSCVADAASFVVTSSTGMTLSISTGDGLIKVDDFNARRIQTTTAESVTVSAASASYGRLDSIVAYIDNSVSPTTSVVDNTNDILKFKVVAGTAAATPVAPTASAIQSSVGAGNPYMILYDGLVPQSATNTSGMTFTDRRKILTSVSSDQLASSSITTAKIADNNVTTPKIANDAVTDAKLVYGKLRSRKGGSTTNWSMDGTTNYDTSSLNVFMQAGLARSNDTTTGAHYGWYVTSTQVVVFPVPYTQIPLVFVSSISDHAVATVLSVSTTQFEWRGRSGASVAASSNISWYAIGE